MQPGKPVVMRVGVIAGAMAAAAHGQVTFESLGFLPAVNVEPSARVTHISADGNTVIGVARVGPGSTWWGTEQIFCWRAGAGVAPLGEARSWGVHTGGVSADGSVIAGYHDAGAEWRAYGWFHGVFRDILTPFGEDRSVCTSGSGIICGISFNPVNFGIFFFDGTTVTMPVPQPGPGGGRGPVALSADGSVLVGRGQSGGFRWSEATGVQDLPSLHPSASSWPQDISSNGRIIVGWAIDAEDCHRAVAWREETGYSCEVLTPAAVPSNAYRISGDGRRMLVWMGGEHYLRESHNGQMRVIEKWLQPVVPPGWEVRSAIDISRDGRVIVGTGIDPQGRMHPWRATIGEPCYANCDGQGATPILDVADFVCFLQRFLAEDPYANCDGSTELPVLNMTDFGCFLQRFAAGCP